MLPLACDIVCFTKAETCTRALLSARNFTQRYCRVILSAISRRSAPCWSAAQRCTEALLSTPQRTDVA